MYGDNVLESLELVEAEHWVGRFVRAKFSDLSTVVMTVAQYDAIMDHAYEIVHDW